jgi:hypothetical protein
MKMIQKIATAGAVAAMGLGLGAASASAYDITGGNYVGTGTAQHSFTIDGAYTINCDATFTGNTDNVAGDTNSTDFAPAFANCDFFGFPADVTPADDWRLTVTGGGSGNYTGQIELLGDVDIAVPIADCYVNVASGQVFADGAGGNILTGTQVGSDFELIGEVNNINWTSTGTGCPWLPNTSGSTAVYSTNGPVEIPGVSVTP